MVGTTANYLQAPPTSVFIVLLDKAFDVVVVAYNVHEHLRNM